MSRECCGPDEDEQNSAPVRLTASSSAADASGATDADPPASLGVSDAGADDETDEPFTPWWRDRAIQLPVAAGVLLGIGYLFEWTGLDTVALVVLGASLLAGASTFVPGALKRLTRGRLGVGLLMTIAAIGAVLLGRIGEAAALAFLFSIAEALEDRALDKARHGLRALLSLIPETAIVSRRSSEVTIPVRELRKLDLLIIRPGDRVATDGIVTSGRSSIDTSAVTGESIPVEVGPGDAVPAGSINGNGALQLEATADGRDNSLTTIVRLVEQAHAKKGNRARLADRIAKPLVPAVLILAGLIVVFGFLVGDPLTWTERALVVLVAASPCALAIAVPVTVISAIGSASRFGVVIKSGEAFEQLSAVRMVAFDKTGTLTRNTPEVVAVETLENLDRAGVLQIAAALEAQSTHPLAAAVLAEVPRPVTATEITEHPGSGVAGLLDGVPVRVGNPRWVGCASLDPAREAMEAAGMTVIVVERNGTPVGIIGIRDELRPEAADAVARLRADGIDTVMLTGDNERTARALASAVGIDRVHAQQSPADKAAAIEKLTAAGRTAMIGDGINDAPALASASVGIAMGATGSAAAIESADIAFTGTDLRLIPQALAHARRGGRIMTANILLALAIIVVLFPLALTGVLGLAGVVLVHEVAEVVVIGNGIRAARRPPALPVLSVAAPSPAEGIRPVVVREWEPEGFRR